jgi:hypothetical protein
LLPDESKLSAVKEFPIPNTTKKRKGFLDLAGYYRRFIPNFRKIAKPLNNLLKNNIPFIWNEDTDEAFNTLNRLISQPLLQYPHFSKPFILTRDAINDALGVVLSHRDIGRDLTVAYASRTLSKAARNYPTIEKELLEIVWRCKYFRPYLYGKIFTVVTDKRPIVWIFNVKDPSSRLLIWRLKQEEYEYNIVYKRGSSNTNADALSRIHVAETPPTEQEKLKIFQEMHMKPAGGHLDINKTYENEII